MSLFADQPVEIPVKESPDLADPAFAERRPMSILLVEDNAVNQKLALLFLELVIARIQPTMDSKRFNL